MLQYMAADLPENFSPEYTPVNIATSVTYICVVDKNISGLSLSSMAILDLMSPFAAPGFQPVLLWLRPAPSRSLQAMRLIRIKNK